jgi:putative redox protein
VSGKRGDEERKMPEETKTAETTTEEPALVARVVATIGTAPYAVAIETRHHPLISDEPKAMGGGDAGAAPFELVLAGLGACTAITLRMYAARKQWPLQGVDVKLTCFKEGARFRVERIMAFDGELSAEQRARLADIAERTPVTLALKSGMDIRTSFR